MKVLPTLTIHNMLSGLGFSATFNNISVISVKEHRVHEEDQRHAASHWQTLSHNVVIVVLSTPHRPCIKSGLSSHYGFGDKLCTL